MLPFSPCFRECCQFFGDNGLTLKVFFTKAAPFGVLWTLTNYLYLHAIKKINTTDVSVLFCCNKAFVFLLSWIVLRDRFMGVRVSDSLSLSPFFPSPFCLSFSSSLLLAELSSTPCKQPSQHRNPHRGGTCPSLQPAQAPSSSWGSPYPPARCLCTFSFRKEVTCSRAWQRGSCYLHVTMDVHQPLLVPSE